MLLVVLNSFLTNVIDLVTKKALYYGMTTGIKNTTKNDSVTQF
jgi:hypothetical protein